MTKMHKQILVLALFFCCVASSEWILKDLRIPRVRSAAARVGNKIYIAGGEISGGIETASIEVLNTDNYEFEQVDLKLPSPRQRFTAVPIGSKIYFTGGSQNTIDVYDTSSNAWNVMTIVELANVNVTFAGSLGGQLVLTTNEGNALFIDPSMAKVTTTLNLGDYSGTAIPPTRTFMQAPEYNGQLYVAYGNDIIGFDTASSQKLIRRSESSAVVNHMLFVNATNPLLVIVDISANQLYYFVLNMNRWDARLLSGRRTDYSIASVGSSAHIMGGASKLPNGTATDFSFGFFFNTAYYSLSQKIDLKAPRSQMTPFVAPNAALFIGGVTDSGEYSSTIDIIYEGELKPPTASVPNSNNNNTPRPATSGCGTPLMNIVVAVASMSVLLFN
eukprot:TRINITY_DN5773_c0_g1_i1.p1 TRINITY_DN5773_c0_g1~~TRINITY_DN5773_c0_g1_i1.p1  ORF type:complete len:388 (+),score=45.58 TRINITY_DN5773_c0_g1_i1:118-1281(+)